MNDCWVLLSYKVIIRIILKHHSIIMIVYGYIIIFNDFWPIPLGCFIATVHENSISFQRFLVRDGTCNEICRYSSGFRSRDHIAHDIKIAVRISTTLTRLGSNMVNRIFVSGLASNFAGLGSHGFYAKIGENDGDLCAWNKIYVRSTRVQNNSKIRPRQSVTIDVVAIGLAAFLPPLFPTEKRAKDGQRRRRERDLRL